MIRSPSPKGAGGGCIDPAAMLARDSAGCQPEIPAGNEEGIASLSRSNSASPIGGHQALLVATSLVFRTGLRDAAGRSQNDLRNSAHFSRK